MFLQEWFNRDARSNGQIVECQPEAYRQPHRRVSPRIAARAPLHWVEICLIAQLFSSSLRAETGAETEEIIKLDAVVITGDAETRQRTPGSVHKIDQQALEQWKHTDIHRVLEEVPGVYVRGEDGWGLRPNIGMRGAGSDRSKKIALMEDGILFAPAPYSAPAAYYFPLMPRMQSVEVFKGPAAIQYGPNTVGGAINFVSRDIPGSEEDEEDLNGAIDLALGNYAYGKLHGYYGESTDRYGWLLEGVHLQSDGFKELDGGGDTGFDKNDILFKARFNSDFSADIYHQFDLKIGYADEESDETYLGLTDDDFDANPLRRYAASQLDNMSWDHQQYSLNHYMDPGGSYALNTTIYRREFSRVWDKLNGFSGGAPDLQEILSDPYSPVNSIFYEVLTGQSDSLTPTETLLMGANARDFIAQGIQTQIEWEPEIAGYVHEIRAGLRYHEDEIIRNHSERGFLMQSGEMVHDGNPTRFTTRNRASAEALALHLHDDVTFGDLTLSGGVRAELIETDFINRLTGDLISRSDDVIIPGLGISYKTTPNLRLLAGVHKGFVPVPPGSDPEVEPEESINYEFGLRFSSGDLRAEAIGFFNDYSNLTGVCTFSSGCATSELDLGFNAGEVDIWGLEAVLEKTFASSIQGRLEFPVKLIYTWTTSEFKNAFTSPRPDLRDVNVGDELPYLPEHQLTLKAGVSRHQWRGAVAFTYVAEMRTSAGTGEPADNERTDQQTIVDLTLDYQLTNRSQIYFSADNLFDDEAIVARRPFGARPGKPRTLSMGYKMNF
ncbi:MAG: TonB-dependent receptor [Gammaproteobacteria bacterium]|nr:TonB-dependent receptor [Gammaproteobacteria bacterium]